MNLTQFRRSNRIARRAGYQGARSAEVSTLGPVFEKSDTESNNHGSLLKCRKSIKISTFNVRSLNSLHQTGELIASAEEFHIDVICIQEHRFFHDDITLKYHDLEKGWCMISASAWKNSVNATIGGVGILLSPKAKNCLNNIEMISKRIVIATFQSNPKLTVISCYSPTNVSILEDVEYFYSQLSSLLRQTPKHNLLLVGGDFNAHTGITANNKFAYHKDCNRNGELLNDFVIENGLVCLNTKFQKKNGKLWTFTHPTGSKSQIDYILVNKKWKNSVTNCEAYNSMETVYSDHRIVSAKIRLSLRQNQKKSMTKTPAYDWSSLNDPQIADEFSITLKNRFDILQVTTNVGSADTSYENFITAHEYAAQKCVPKKPKTHKQVPWETGVIIEKRKTLKAASKRKRLCPTRNNVLNVVKAQKELAEAYLTEQQKYIQEEINKLENAHENKKSALAWKIINKLSGRKSTNKAKLRAKSEEERISLWAKHFKDLLGKNPLTFPLEILPVVELTLDVKTGHFSLDELDAVLKAIKSRKSPGLDNIPPEVWKTRKFDKILLGFCNSVYDNEPIQKWTQGCILPFPKKGDLGVPKNYRGITLTSIAAKVYNALLLNRIKPAIEPILRKNQNGFRKNRSTTSQILTF